MASDPLGNTPHDPLNRPPHTDDRFLPTQAEQALRLLKQMAGTLRWICGILIFFAVVLVLALCGGFLNSISPA